MTTTLVDRSTANAPDPRLWLGVMVPTTGIILTCLALAIAWTGNLPTNVAQQWEWETGEVNTIAPLWLMVLEQVGLAFAALVALAIMKWAGKLTGWGRRSSTGSLAGISVMLSCSIPAILHQQVGITDPHQAPDPRLTVLILAVVSVAYGFICAIIVGGRPLEADNPTSKSVLPLDLGPNEIAVWSQHVTAWIFLLTGTISGLGLVLAAMTTQLWFLAPVGGILLAFGIVAGRWTINVDHQGLTCTTRFGLGRFNAPAAPSSTADVTKISGFSEILGWGLRIGSAKSIGLIFHNGEALRIQHPDGRSLTVTIKDATTAASLFNAQSARNRKTA